MTPKEKAEDLVKKFFIYNHIGHKHAVRYALIAVDEIIESRREDQGFDDTLYATGEYHTPHPMYLTYWNEVKQEIKRYESM
ncbi:hypothetical protein UFOVP449_226 [uncultured Caudovirales phage]|uniref:Uncharacterized protein n=1 Tax=uncultured Caudovirales phage TaxID=2100421 RepID=A0A6J5MA92_9CAUD|nr:hypothetical protein UFOVP449_226 [uncultured Caudovirales phage]